MASLCEISEEQAEEEELELYGLNDEEEDSDEERAAVEEAMFMRIHYGNVGENEEQTEKLASDNTCEASAASKNRESVVDVDNGVDINVSVYRPGNDNRSYPDIEKPKAGAHVVEDKDKSVLVEEDIEKSDEKETSNKLDDSVILLEEDMDGNDLDSKYSLTNFAGRLRQALSASRQSVLGRPNGKSSEDTKMDPKVIDVSKNVANNIDECYTVVTSDSDSDVCVLTSSPKKVVVENEVSKAHSDATKKPSSATKIDRSSFLKPGTSSNRVDGQKVKQRTWKGKNTTPVSSKYANTDLISLWEESTMKPEKYRITYSRVRSSAKHGGSGANHGGKLPVEEVEGENSEDDCMLIESMSEDEDMAFNFVHPLGAGKSKQTQEYTDSQENEGSKNMQPGLGSKGPKCLNCNEFGHPARYCPQSKDESNSASKPGPLAASRYFLSEQLGLGSQGPKCSNCNGFGHPARYCPEPKKEVGDNPKTLIRPNRYFQQQSSPKSRGGPKCLNCYEFGHLARNCPEPKRIPTCVLCGEKGHFDRVCPDALCFKCGLPGHRATECESSIPARFMRCWRCNMQGHDVTMCPDKWRQFHLTMKPGKAIAPSQKARKRWWNAKIYCCNCGKLGHHAYECLQERMNQHTPIACPFVWRYDAKPVTPLHVPKRKAKTKDKKKRKPKKPKIPKKTLERQERKRITEMINKLRAETLKAKKKAKKEKKNLESAPKPVPEENLAALQSEIHRPQTRSWTRKKMNQLMKQDNNDINEVSLQNKTSKQTLEREERRGKEKLKYLRQKGGWRHLTKEEKKEYFREKRTMRRQRRKEKREALKAVEIKVEDQPNPKTNRAKRRREKRKLNKRLTKAVKYEQQASWQRDEHQARQANRSERVVEFVSPQGFKFNFSEPY